MFIGEDSTKALEFVMYTIPQKALHVYPVLISFMPQCTKLVAFRSVLFVRANHEELPLLVDGHMSTTYTQPCITHGHNNNNAWIYACCAFSPPSPINRLPVCCIFCMTKEGNIKVPFVMKMYSAN